MTTRFQRRHEKLLRDYLEVTRDLGEAEVNGASRNAIDRLNVRQRSLVAAIRRARIELGLPATFDADMEIARLRAQERKSIRALRTDELRWTERPRVRPVPQPATRTRPTRAAFDLATELVAHAARFCARRAAEELLEHRLSTARGHPADGRALWPELPLARTANGEIYAGSAGRLMGELIARADDSELDADTATIAIRCYVSEFTGCVVTALHRERGTVGHTDEGPNPIVNVRNELNHAAHSRLAVEARAVSPHRNYTTDDVAAAAERDVPSASNRRILDTTKEQNP